MKVIKNNLMFYLVIALVVVLLLLGVAVGMKTVFSTQEKTTKFGLANVGELVTQTCYTTVVEDSKVDVELFEGFKIPFSESRQIFSYDFEVDASLNFDRIKIKNINDKDKKIIFELPHSKVYKTTINMNSLKVYLDSDGFFSRIDLDSHNEALKKMEKTAKDDCVANKLLDSADKNAEQIISSLVKGNANYKDYTVEFEYK